ncbi:hypothetical protein [Zhihengliuella sp. ISTPL4]|uniref:hypothetical protein n=1 Tax=Zhihengliuella sp. ISTPL4 TaxID=2058657 RepID=UPI0013050B58|nr:hypothetical protein [Zhihengliuella sp. ISTPL4]
MTTLGVARDLAAILVPIGYVGAALAAICAIVAAIAIIRGAGGLAGGAVGLWIVCALMSFTASFANQWLPLIAAGASLVGMLVIGGIVRAMLTAGGFESRRRAARVKPAKPAPATTTTATLKTGSTATPTAPVAVVS